MHVGESEVAAGVAIGELLVVESQAMQHRGVQVVDVHRFLLGFETEFIGRAVNVSATYSTARHPHREPMVIVVAAVHLACVCSLFRQFDHRGPAELTAPQHQRFIQKTALFEISQQRTDRSALKWMQWGVEISPISA